MKIIRGNIWHQPLNTDTQPLQWSHWNDVIPIGNSIICFNTHSGSVVVFSNNEYRYFKEHPQNAPKVLQQICILVSASTDEKEEWKTQYLSSKQDYSFLDLTIVLTLQCQFDCVYCFEGEKSESILTQETSEAIKLFVEEHAEKIKVLHITWFGGEPLLGFERIQELSTFFIHFCKQHGIKYCADITTNGYALTKERCVTLIHELQIKRYIITVDGTADTHNKRRPLQNGKGTFNKIWNNINYLIENEADVTIRMTIDKNNVKDIKPLIDYIGKSLLAGKVGLTFVRTIDYSFTPENIRKTLYTKKEFASIEMELIRYANQKGLLRFQPPRPCPTGGCIRKGDIVIGTQGEIYKCLDTIGQKQWITAHISNVELSIKKDWYQQWLNWEPSKSVNCTNCKLQPLCNGGCPHNALFTDKKHGSQDQCPDWKHNYQEIIKEYVTEKISRNEYEEI